MVIAHFLMVIDGMASNQTVCTGALPLHRLIILLFSGDYILRIFKDRKLSFGRFFIKDMCYTVVRVCIEGCVFLE